MKKSLSLTSQVRAAGASLRKFPLTLSTDTVTPRRHGPRRAQQQAKHPIAALGGAAPCQGVPAAQVTGTSHRC